MTKKKLASAKGLCSLGIILAYAAFCAFFFTYGRFAVQRAANEMNEQQTLGGLGAAFAYVYALVFLLAFAVPTILFLISTIGNLTKKGEKLVGFTVVSLVAEILGMIALFLTAVFFMAATLYDILSVVAMAVFFLLVLIGFIHSITVLSKAKKAED